MTKCDAADCERKRGTKAGYCLMHYKRWKRHGNPIGKRSKIDGVWKSKSSAYNRWRLMLNRCTKPYSEGWLRYGAKGIRVCERWHSFSSFIEDMGLPPAGHTLDRINSDGNYEPSNCRWATHVVQNRNRKFCRPITYEGRTQLLTDWAKKLGVMPNTIGMRLDTYGWSIEKALTTPGKKCL